MVGGLIHDYEDRNGGAAVATIIGVTTGIAPPGYFAGRQADQRVKRIKAVP